MLQKVMYVGHRGSSSELASEHGDHIVRGRSRDHWMGEMAEGVGVLQDVASPPGDDSPFDVPFYVGWRIGSQVPNVAEVSAEHRRLQESPADSGRGSDSGSDRASDVFPRVRILM